MVDPLLNALLTPPLHPTLYPTPPPAALTAHFAGAAVIFHCASYGMSGTQQLQRRQVEAVNVGGTRAVVGAAVAAGVPRLVYLSTYNVVFGGQVVRGGDESLPYFPLHKHPDCYRCVRLCVCVCVWWWCGWGWVGGVDGGGRGAHVGYSGMGSIFGNGLPSGTFPVPLPALQPYQGPGRADCAKGQHDAAGVGGGPRAPSQQWRQQRPPAHLCAAPCWHLGPGGATPPATDVSEQDTWPLCPSEVLEYGRTSPAACLLVLMPAHLQRALPGGGAVLLPHRRPARRYCRLLACEWRSSGNRRSSDRSGTSPNEAS